MADGGLWRFSLTLYVRPGVAELCLQMQDRHDVDVNMALFCLYSGLRRGRLGPDAMEAAATLSHDWREATVRPLRRTRQQLKPRAEALERAGLAASAFRERVKALELDAEREQQRALAPLAEDAAPPAGPDAANDNWRAYLARAAIAEAADLQRDWTALLAQARQVEETRT